MAIRQAVPLVGNCTAEIHQELHQDAFGGIPGESDPFVLTLLEREFVAFVLALWHKCGHCVKFHGDAVAELLEKESCSDWNWKDEMVRFVGLFRDLTEKGHQDITWDDWQSLWTKTATQVHVWNSQLLVYIAFSVGVSIDSDNLREGVLESIIERFSSNLAREGVVRDILKVTTFMALATMKNRVEPKIMIQLMQSRTSKKSQKTLR